LRCLQKDPARRYRTARDLADDLLRYRNGVPVLARPVGRVERCWRWCRRNPRVAALLGLLVVVITTALATVTLLWRRADEQRRLAERNEAEAVRQQKEADEQRRHAESSEAQTKIQKEAAETERGRAVAEAEKARRVAEFLGGVFEAADPLGLSGYGSIIPKAT